MGCGCGATHAQGWQGAGTQRRVPDFSSRYRGLRDAPGTGWVPTAHGTKAAVRSVHGSQPCVAGGRRSEGKSSPAETDAIPSEPDGALPFCSHIPSQGRFRGGALPTTGLSVTRKKDEQGETVTSPKPAANAVPGRPGQVRQNGVRWCRSRRAGCRRVPAPLRGRRSSAESRAPAPRSRAKRGRHRPRRGRPLGGQTARGTPRAGRRVPGSARLGTGGLRRGPVLAAAALPLLLPGRARAEPGAGGCEAAPWGETHRGDSGCEEPERILFWQRQPRQQSELAEESSHRRAFLPANGSTAGPPHALGWPGPRFLRQGPPGRREVGKGRPPEQARARGDRDRGGDRVKTSCRRLEGRSTAGCAPPVPDSLELPPAAAPARTAGSHRRVSALLKPSQMPHRRSPVPSGCRLCRGGSGSPPRAGSSARPRSAARSVSARPQRLGRSPARQRREGRCGPGSPAAGTPLPARYYPRLRAASPGQAPAGKPGGKVAVEPPGTARARARGGSPSARRASPRAPLELSTEGKRGSFAYPAQGTDRGARRPRTSGRFPLASPGLRIGGKRRGLPHSAGRSRPLPRRAPGADAAFQTGRARGPAQHRAQTELPAGKRGADRPAPPTPSRPGIAGG
ncbi:collagen alpha-1(I) chain-like [Melospiza georgiana]|uniref:collagen alpha-1(I) chain-like n=1 Tax=Melospiza georgiana TaxID=44398 RepID=UPI0025ABFCA4|nr:collagen alpha-1(I) chain-like [Melospiza georgiana]